MYMNGMRLRALADDSWGDIGQVDAYDPPPVDIWDVPGVPSYVEPTRDIWDVNGVPTYVTPSPNPQSPTATSTPAIPSASGSNNGAVSNWANLFSNAFKTWGTYKSTQTAADIQQARINQQIAQQQAAAAAGAQYVVGPNGQLVPVSQPLPATLFGISTPVVLLLGAGAALIMLAGDKHR